MAHLDIFNNDAFSMVEMLSAVDNVEYRPNRLQSLGLTEVKNIRTESVSIETRTDRGVGLIQTTPRGANLERVDSDSRDIRDFRTTRIGEFDKLTAAEIANIRAFGQESELMQAAREVQSRLNKLEEDIALTEEHMLLGMIQGVVVDADGSEIYNWYDELNVTPAAEIDFDLTGSATLSTIRQQCIDILRAIRRNAKGAMFNGAHAFCGDEFFDALVTNPEIEKIYLNQQAASELRDEVSNIFRFGGITFENYIGTDDNSTVAIESTKAKIIPANARGVFVEARAPGESFSVINQPGRRRYAQVIPDRDRDEWVRVEMKTYPLFVCQRPAMLRSAKI